ncbi:MAG: SLC13 family permease [Bacilli bacterium]
MLGNMIVLLTLVIMICSLLFFPKIKLGKKVFDAYWIIVLLGATFIILTFTLDLKSLWSGLINNNAMNPVKLVILFIMMTFFSLLLDELGFFKWAAFLLLKKIKNSQMTLFISLYFLVALLTIVTSNDVIILTFTPLVIYFAREAKIKPLPYLFAILTAANTWSIMLIVGNPTNMYLALNAGVSFFEYFKVLYLPAIGAGLSGLFVLLLLFRQDLKLKFEGTEETFKMQDKPLTFLTLFMMVSTLILLAIANFIKIELYLIVLMMALFLTVLAFIYLFSKKKDFAPLTNAYLKAPWSFIPLVLSMFVLVETLKQNGAITYFATLLTNGNVILNYGLSSFLTSNLMNNQPMSMLFSEILLSANALDRLPAMYASVIGSNLGVLLTPLGALAGLMWMNILKNSHVELNFFSYIKHIFLVGILTMVVSLSLLQLVL